MYPETIGLGIKGYRCSWPDCGHFMNEEQVSLFKGMQMVEE
jgi:hypothetical protein